MKKYYYYYPFLSQYVTKTDSGPCEIGNTYYESKITKLQ